MNVLGNRGAKRSGEATSSSLLNKDGLPLLLKRRGRRFSAGRGMCRVVRWTILFLVVSMLTLQVQATPDMEFGGDVPFHGDGDGTYVSGSISANEYSTMSMQVEGPGYLAFDWWVSSEEDYDKLCICVDGVEVCGSISGEPDKWMRVAYNIDEAGGHVIEWRYVKNDSIDVGEDKGKVRGIVYAPTVDPALFGYKLTEDGAVITNVSADVSGEIALPSSLGGHPVVGIERDGNNFVFECPTNIISVVIPEGYRFIGYSVFAGESEGWHYISNACSKLTSISLPSTLRSIGSEAFRGCVALQNISFPEGITNLPNGVVEYCTGLKCVTIPSTVEEIDTYAFRGCEIAYFRVAEDNPYYCSDYVGFLYDKSKKTLVRASGGGDEWSLNYYLWGNGWHLPDTLEVISQGSFQGYNPMYGIYFEIPASVTNIESGAFSDCYGVNATVAADNAFFSHDWRKAILSKDGTTLVDYFANGSSYTIPNTVTNVAVFAFMASRGLSQLTIPDAVRRISPWSFVWCEDLREIVLPKRVEILDWAFAQCSGLRRVVMPEGSDLKKLYDGCFQYCTNMTEVVLTEGLEYLGGSVFWKCTALTELTLPESVVVFSEGSISECYALTNLFFRGRPVPGNTTWRGTYHPLSEDLVGYYRPKYADEWQAVLDERGLWRGIPMFEKAMPNKVTFDLGAHGQRVGGGELIQTVLDETAAIAPEVSVETGWCFAGWDKTFDCVETNLMITAIYHANIEEPNKNKHGTENTSSYNGVYDGASHGLDVKVTDPEEGYVVRYATDKDGPYYDALAFKDVCTEVPVWYEISAPGYLSVTNWATVTITAKTITSDMLAYSDNAFFFDGSKTKVPDVVLVDTNELGVVISTENDWTRVYGERLPTGEWPVTLTGKNNYTGSATALFKNIKRPVAYPVIPSQSYNGKTRKPTITIPKDENGNDLYQVVENPGGINAGFYTNVVLRLINTTDYKWKGYSEDGSSDWTGVFEIRKASNGWSTYPGIDDWTEGETPSEPKGKARYGTVSVAYRVRGAAVETETAAKPSAPGKYTARFWVEATQNYAGVALATPYDVDFEIYRGPNDPLGGGDVVVGDVTVPCDWLAPYAATFGNGSPEAAATAKGLNGLALWESYVAGLDPTDATSQFTATIVIGADGTPVITWSPDLTDGNPPRTYTTYGRESLGAGEWEPVTEANKAGMKFFKIGVELGK